jgi:hypothetical protein
LPISSLSLAGIRGKVVKKLIWGGGGAGGHMDVA